MEHVIDQIRALEGLSAALACAGVFIVANAALFPATILSVACGFLLPLPIAIPTAALSRSLTALLCSSLSRTLFRKPIWNRLNLDGRLGRLEQALSRGGFTGVLLLRLSPVFPSGPSNYILGLTGVPVFAIFAGTLLGTLPNTVIGVVAGAGLSQIAEIREYHLFDSTQGRTLIAVGIIATIILVRVIRKHWQVVGNQT